MNFLLVEDDRDDLYAARRVIKSSEVKHNIVEANFIEDAIELYNTMDFDVIVTDMVFPNGKTGLEFLKLVIKNGRSKLTTPPIYILSTFPDRDLEKLCILEGAVAFIPKPLKEFHVREMQLRSLEHTASFILTATGNRK